MRVIAGTARSLPLKTPAGEDTRPTTDRIKETLFNMIAPGIPGCRFLDLFGGSGGIGIEALSRGASYAAFADNSKEACECIRENLSFTRLEDKARVFEMDAIGALKVMEGEPAFDYIFIDPPYGQGLERKVLQYFDDSTLISPETTVILETKIDEDTSWVIEYEFCVVREKRYKTNKHLFIGRTGEVYD